MKSLEVNESTLSVGPKSTQALEGKHIKEAVKSPLVEKRKRLLEKEENIFEKNRKERKYKYIGETHRSAYEREK